MKILIVFVLMSLVSSCSVFKPKPDKGLKSPCMANNVNIVHVIV